MNNILTRLSKREKTVLTAAVIAVFAALFDRAVLTPIIEKMHQFDEEIKTMEFELNKNSKILQQRQRIERDEKKFAPFAIDARSEEEETAALLGEIENLASQSSVFLSDLKPSGTAAEGSAKKYLVNVTCEAPMDKLIGFFYRIERSESLMCISGFALRPKSRSSDVIQCELLVSKVVLP